MDQFKSSLTLITKVIPALMIAIATAVVVATLPGRLEYGYVSLIAPVVIYGVVIFCFFDRSLRYEIGEGFLKIIRPKGAKSYSVYDIKSVEFIGSLPFGTIRTFANGGLFGFTGWYYNRKLGKFRAFMTRMNHSVLVAFNDGKKIMLSPDDAMGFVTCLTKYIKK